MVLISRRALLSSVALAGASVLARGASQRGPWAQGTAPALGTDEHVRRFNAKVPQMVQWDDHETTNNWFPGGVIDERNPRFKQYTVTSHDLLAAYAKRAFSEYTPIGFDAHDPERIYRAFGYGPFLDIFMLDERSYRGPNSGNRQETPGTETAFLGTPQVQWLKRALLNARATWKVIASDMPLGLQVPDILGFEACTNGDGLQFFGMVKVSGKDEVMTVSLHNLRGEKIYSIDLNPEV